MPPTVITRSLGLARKFLAEQGDIVIKPLHGFAGGSVFRVGGDGRNLASLMELFNRTYREPHVLQKFIPEIAQGDKRIVLIDGEVAGAVNRVPGEGEIRSNLAVGGKPAKAELTDLEKLICSTLAPELKARGLVFVGIDVIGGQWLTEINVTSPTGIVSIDELNGSDTPALFWKAVEAKLPAR
jgi:glutathione synthase